jgi:hypothetical protein
MSINMEEKRFIAALDFGDGNISGYTSVFGNKADKSDTAKVFMNEKELSAYTVFDDERTTWGNNTANDLTAEDLERVVRLEANIKSLPGTGTDGKMIELASIVYKDYSSLTNNFRSLTPEWFIGCPSAWQKIDGKIKDEYAAVFNKAGMENVHIIEESTAAFAYYDRYLLASTYDRIAAGILLIDWGSSTLDATFIHPKKEDEWSAEIETDGCPLGAQYIDIGIVNCILENPDKYGMNQFNKDPALVKKVTAKYKSNKNFRTLMHLYARDLKEKYFKALSTNMMLPPAGKINWRLAITLSDKTSEWGKGYTEFYLGLSINMMNDILTQPISKIIPDFSRYNDYTREDLGNDSFVSRNDRFIKMLSEKYPEYAAKDDALIIMTGGASQMKFVRESVAKHFPNKQIDYDTDPELTIAKGLVFYGHEALKNKQFEDDFDKVVFSEIEIEGEKHDAKLFGVLYEAYTELVKDVAVTLSKYMTTALLESLLSWQNTEIQCESIPRKAAENYAKIVSNEFSSYKNIQINEYKNSLRQKLNEMFTDLCKKYNINRNIFEGDFAPEVIEFADLIFNKVMEWIKEAIEDSNYGTSLGNGLGFWRKMKIDSDAVIENAKELLFTMAKAAYDYFTDKEFLQAILLTQYAEISKELNSKKESLLYHLGLVTA